MLDILHQQINVVARLRQASQNHRDLVDMAKSHWETEHAEILLAAAESAMETKQAEDKLRQMTLEIFEQTGDKHPAEGVGIREITRLEYDAELARDWAVEHKVATKLDVVMFEKIAKIDPPSFVTIEIVPQATIATDLSKELKEE